MSGNNRNYHSVQHVFDISQDFTDPLAILAALFHDAIYHSVDQTLSPQQELALSGCFQMEKDETDDTNGMIRSMTCRSHQSCQQDPMLCLVETIFGYEQRGQEITSQDGINEFLSAVLAVRSLKEHLTVQECAKIAVCIAATIPFRNKPTTSTTTLTNPNNDDGTTTTTTKSHMEKLYDNLAKANISFDLKMTQQELVQSIQRGAIMANADVANFGSDDIYYFLDKTWSLLTETNTTLRSSFLFTVMEFQHSLYKMNGFFHFLDPTCIFASYEGVPSSCEIQQKTEQAHANLLMGQKYVGAKLLSASVLAAFAALTGGDAPLSLFVGDLPSRHHQSQSINDGLPVVDDDEQSMYFLDNHEDDGDGDDDGDDASDDFVDDTENHLDLLVYQILTGGRRSETSFDVKQSPLGAFLYGVVGDRGLRMILDNKTLYPMTEENAEALLACLPREVVVYLAKTIASVAICRAEEIMEVVKKIPVKTFDESLAESGSYPPAVSESEE